MFTLRDLLLAEPGHALGTVMLRAVRSVGPETPAPTVAQLMFGLEHGVDKLFGEAPVFWGIFTGLSALGATVGVLIPRSAVVQLLLVVQVVNGVLLPLLLIFIIRLVNNREIMGAYVNGWVFNALAWATVVAVAGLSLLMVVTTVLPGFGLHLFEL